MSRLFLSLCLLLTTGCEYFGDKVKDNTVQSVENIENNGDDSIAITVAEADVPKDKVEEIAEEYVENIKVLDVAAEVGKEAIDLSAKTPEEVVTSTTQNTQDSVRNVEEKAKGADVAVGKAQQSIEGIWDTGTENTKIEISQNNGEWVGKIISSDNEKATIGKVILKDLKKQNEIWKGELFVVKRQKWTDVEIVPNGNKLDLIVSAGPSSRKVQWSKANN